jgi:DNA polymerase III subunit epsilon
MYVKDTLFYSVDIETTGLDINSDEIIAFASVPMNGTRIMMGSAYYTLIKPNIFKLQAMKYHGISMNDVAGSPSFSEVASDILQALGGVIVGYSISFDYQFLKRDLKKTGVKLKKDTIDIMLVDKWLAQESGRTEADFSFEAMMQRYGLRESYRHNALADAFFAAQIFQVMLHRLSQMGIDKLERIKKIIKSCRYSLW